MHAFNQKVHAVALLEQGEAGERRLWSDEKWGDGKRNWIVATPDEMWREMMARSGDRRTLYEVIYSKRPCFLYVDLDWGFASARTPDTPATREEWEACVAAVMACVAVEFAAVGVRNVDAVDAVWQSDSHSPGRKWSTHLVWHGGPAFEDNLLCKPFMERVARRMDKRAALRYNPLDLGVYGRDRCMRMLGSTKRGQKRWLTSAQWADVDLAQPLPAWCRRSWEDGLICGVPAGRACLTKALVVGVGDDEDAPQVKVKPPGKGKHAAANAPQRPASRRRGAVTPRLEADVTAAVERVVPDPAERRAIHIVVDGGEATVRLDSGYCPLAGRRHSRSAAVINVNLATLSVRVHCFNCDATRCLGGADASNGAWSARS